MKIFQNTVFLFVAIIISQVLKAQDVQVSEQNYFKKFMKRGISVGGYFRGLYFVRDMPQPYGTIGEDKIVSLPNDPVYYDPMLYMYIGGAPNDRTSFGLDVNIYNPFAGPAKKDVSSITLFNSLVLRASFDLRKKGSYYMTAGGIEWVNLTPFTFGGNPGYNRYSVFERRPWDPGGEVKRRYSSYYHSGVISQDVRFGTAGFKGLYINGSKLPFKLGFDLFYNSNLETTPSKPRSFFAGRISRPFKNIGTISVNGVRHAQYTDSINADNAMFRILTVMGHLNIKKIRWVTEIGYGGYKSPIYPEAYDFAVQSDIEIPKEYTKIPLSFRFYSIGKNFVNNNAAFSNTTTSAVNDGVNIQDPYSLQQTNSIFQPVGGQAMNVGVTANNRRGGNVNTNINIGNIRLSIGNEIAADISKYSKDTISYGHRINGLTWSRFAGVFPNPFGNYGPNNRVNSIYRGAYEMVGIKDADSLGNLLYKLHYNASDIQVKFKFTLLGREFFIFNLNSISSVQNKISAIPIMNKNAYLQIRYHEFEAYYNIRQNLTLDFYYGLERIIGNDRTDSFTNVNGDSRNRNQTGTGYGVGLDYLISGSTNLYVRYRWFDYKDISIETEKFRGTEAVVELKVFF